MDLKQYDINAAAEEGIRVPLYLPSTNKPLLDEDGVHLTILTKGKDSETWERSMKRHRAKYEAMENVGTHEVNDFVRDILADCCISLEGKFELMGEEITPSNIVKLYKHIGMKWIVEQVLNGAANRAKLFLGAPNGSKNT